MRLLDNASTALQILIVSGASLRIAYCFLRLILSEEEGPVYKKRMRNAIVFAVLAQLVFVIKNLVLAYFG